MLGAQGSLGKGKEKREKRKDRGDGRKEPDKVYILDWMCRLCLCILPLHVYIMSILLVSITATPPSTAIKYDNILHLPPTNTVSLHNKVNGDTTTRPDQNHPIGIDLRSSLVHPSLYLLCSSLTTDLCV